MAVMPNEGHFANFAPKWLPWQLSLEELKKEV